MNPQNIRTGADLAAAEKTIMGKTQGKNKSSADTDPVALYTKELNQLATELGIDLADDREDPLSSPQSGVLGGARTERSRPPGQIQPRTSLGGARREPPKGPSKIDALVSGIDDLDLGGGDRRENKDRRRDRDRGRDRNAGKARKPPRKDRAHGRENPDDEGSGSGSEYSGSGDDEGSGSGSEYSGSGSGDDEGSGSGDDSGDGEGDSGSDSGDGGSRSGDEDEIDVDGVISKLEKDLGIQTDPDKERKRKKIRSHHVGADPERHKSPVTEEQEKRRHLNSVMGEMRQETRTSFGAERERVQDIKANKLNQIDQLRMTLEEEGIDTSAVGKPTQASEMDEIDSVLGILRLKNDRNRYSSLANEVLLGLAEGVESVFDGTRSVPVLGWKPDYTGYHNTVRTKLHRMQFETSQIVGGIIEKYNIGATTRVFMELLPSFFLYPRMQKQQRGAPGLHNDPNVVGPRVANAGMAMMAIRESDERRGDFDTVARI